MFPSAMVLPMFNRQPLVYPRPAASASAEIPCVWQCVAHDLHHHFVRLRFSRRMPLFNDELAHRLIHHGTFSNPSRSLHRQLPAALLLLLCNGASRRGDALCRSDLRLPALLTDFPLPALMLSCSNLRWRLAASSPMAVQRTVHTFCAGALSAARCARPMSAANA